MERVRVIYKYALERIPKTQAQELFKNYTMFEKKFGDRRGIEDVIVNKRRFQYEEEVKVGAPPRAGDTGRTGTTGGDRRAPPPLYLLS